MPLSQLDPNAAAIAVEKVFPKIGETTSKADVLTKLRSAS
jgi:hypothetical protein